MIQKKKTELIDELKFLKEEFVPNFGQISIFTFKNDSKMMAMAKKFNISDQQEQINLMKLIEDRLNLKNDFIMEFLDYSVHYEDALVITLYYEYPTQSLFNEICSRINKKQRFTNQELIQILETLLKAVTYLQQCELIHGNLCIENIFKFDQTWKIIDNFFNEENFLEIQYQKIINENTLYMAPEIFKDLIAQKSEFVKNFYVSEIFSIGLIILEIGLMRSIQDIWNMSNGSLNVDALLGHIQDFSKNYHDDELLKEMIILLLDTNENKRRDPERMSQLYSILKHKKSFSMDQDFQKNDIQFKKVLTYDLEENYGNQESLLLEQKETAVVETSQRENTTSIKSLQEQPECKQLSAQKQKILEKLVSKEDQEDVQNSKEIESEESVVQNDLLKQKKNSLEIQKIQEFQIQKTSSMTKTPKDISSNGLILSNKKSKINEQDQDRKSPIRISQRRDIMNKLYQLKKLTMIQNPFTNLQQLLKLLLKRLTGVDLNTQKLNTVNHLKIYIIEYHFQKIKNRTILQFIKIKDLVKDKLSLLTLPQPQLEGLIQHIFHHNLIEEQLKMIQKTYHHSRSPKLVNLQI